MSGLSANLSFNIIAFWIYHPCSMSMLNIISYISGITPRKCPMELDIIYKIYCLDSLIFLWGPFIFTAYLQILSWYHFFRMSFVTKWLI